MAKYGPKAQEKVEKAMKERKRGTLRSGSGQKVQSRKQAIAIGLSEARRAGGKVPAKRSRKSSGGTSTRGRKKTARTAKSNSSRKPTRKAASSGRRKRARSRR